jgi:hypothetical protein
VSIRCHEKKIIILQTFFVLKRLTYIAPFLRSINLSSR